MLRPDVRGIFRTVSSARAPAAIKAILLDIEGTTTPISFVYDVLFPYARHHLANHIERHASSPEYAQIFNTLRNEHANDVEAAAAGLSSATGTTAIAAYCAWLMNRDRKSTALKDLQGRIWEEGYSRGELVGEVFGDVPPALERWHSRHLSIGIFSSGSVLAQRLLFRHASAGDLSSFLSSYFDTTTGAKSESDSYRKIAASLAMRPDGVLFVSDVVRELEAARTAGMHTRLAVRPGNLPAEPDGHAVIRTFDDLG